jgi:predicted GIY-YIG superfamily endonuclease
VAEAGAGVTFDYGEPTDLYRLYDEDEVLLYVGITNNWSRRRYMHMQDKPWWGEVCQVTFERFRHRSQAERAEPVVIKSERPKYNHMHAVVLPTNRLDDHVTLRVVFNLDGCSQQNFTNLLAMPSRHPGDTLFEKQEGRAVSSLGRVNPCQSLYGELEKLRRGNPRGRWWGFTHGIAGSPIRKPYLSELLVAPGDFDGGDK